MKKTILNIRQTTGKLKQKQGYVFHLSYPKQPLFVIAKEGNNINSSIRWVVSEMTSGLAIAFGQWGGTRKQTIVEAETILRKIGARKLQRQAKEAVKEHGLAN